MTATYATDTNVTNSVISDYHPWGLTNDLYVTNPAATVWSDENIRYSNAFTITNSYPITCGANDSFIAGMPYITGGWDLGIGQGTTAVTARATYYNDFDITSNWSGYVVNCGDPVVINSNEDLQAYLKNQKKFEKRQKIRSRMIIQVKNRAEPALAGDIREQTALDTLREMVTEEEFRNYLRYGFVMVRGRSGDRYQVYRNKSHTRVWRNGKIIEEVCVRIKSDVGAPPTDNVVAFKVAIEADEAAFKAMGNLYRMAA